MGSAITSAAAAAELPSIPPTTSAPINGVGLSDPGMAEQFFQQTAGRYMAPSTTSGLYGSAMGKYGVGGTPTVNNQQGFFDQFKKDIPSVMQTPGLDPYYSNAIRKGEEDINKSMAARGLYGSSAANDMNQELVTNMRADQARNEANYNLQKLGEERNWQGLGGSLAAGADAESLGQSANARNWLGQFGNLAQGADTTNTNMLSSGQAAANASQNAAINRFNTAFGANMGLDQAQAQQMADAYNNMFMSDQGLFNNWLQLGLGPSAQNLNMTQYLTNAQNQNTGNLLNSVAGAIPQIVKAFQGA